MHHERGILTSNDPKAHSIARVTIDGGEGDDILDGDHIRSTAGDMARKASCMNNEDPTRTIAVLAAIMLTMLAKQYGNTSESGPLAFEKAIDGDA